MLPRELRCGRDSFWIPQQTRNWYTAWNHYQQALAWWAGSTDLDLARDRYLEIHRILTGKDCEV